MKFLVVQTAFIGDVILATVVVEKLRRFYPEAEIDFLLRKGNEKLLDGHPQLRKIWIWDKKKEKYRGLLRLAFELRAERYDWVINCQRFAASGLLTVLIGARHSVGFTKNPFSRLFTRRIPHRFGTAEQPIHETGRNLALIEHLTDDSPERPRLYPTEADSVAAKKVLCDAGPYVCIAPTSVWFTKQFPAHKWVELVLHIPEEYAVYLLGGPEDAAACTAIASAAARAKVFNTAGRLSLPASAALMANAAMNYVNDSAPLHLASAMNAPVAAVFCSTLPGFGFTPLSDVRTIVETLQPLSCRPCGLHGRRSCPQGHFACAETIQWHQFPLTK